VKTSYIYDVTLPYGQLLTETTGSATTSYVYGLERIGAQRGTLKTQYVIDGRGNVAQTVGQASNTVVPNISSYVYTPFGEMIGQKTSGFGYNAEWYDAATGMQNLRARQYEPGMMRFGQRDILRGKQNTPISLNRYLYVQNDPVGYTDPSGMYMVVEDAGGRRLTLGQIQKGMATTALQQSSAQQAVKSAQQAITNGGAKTPSGYMNNLANDVVKAGGYQFDSIAYRTNHALGSF
jgi:RHS repeat-associated protein